MQTVISVTDSPETTTKRLAFKTFICEIREKVLYGLQCSNMHVQLVQYVQHVGPFGSFFLHFFTSTKGKQNIDAAMHNWPMFTAQEYVWLFYLSVWKGRNPSL